MPALINLVLTLIQIYFFILMARAILSWIPSLYNSPLAAVLYSLTEPYINLFRGLRFKVFARLDLSFLWAIIFLQMVQMMLREVANGSFVAARDLIWFLIMSVGSVFTFLIFLSLLLVIARLIVSYATNTSHRTMAFLDRWTAPLTDKVRSVIAKRRVVKFRTLLMVTIFMLMLAVFVLNIILSVLHAIVRLIPF
jgi:YggT family protein